MKTCTKCGESKSVTEFGRDIRKRDGKKSACRCCEKVAKSLERAANPEKAKADYAKWYAANRERECANTAAWRIDNPDRVKEHNAKQRTDHPEAHRTYEHNRRARKREAGGRLSTGLAEKLHKLQRGKCACGCKQPLGVNYHMDHIMPIALGGTNTDDNIQLLRSTCNQRKHAKHPVDFMQQRGFLL